jgi:hypothetical protein
VDAESWLLVSLKGRLKGPRKLFKELRMISNYVCGVRWSPQIQYFGGLLAANYPWANVFQTTSLRLFEKPRRVSNYTYGLDNHRKIPYFGGPLTANYSWENGKTLFK